MTYTRFFNIIDYEHIKYIRLFHYICCDINAGLTTLAKNRDTAKKYNFGQNFNIIFLKIDLNTNKYSANNLMYMVGLVWFMVFNVTFNNISVI